MSSNTAGGIHGHLLRLHQCLSDEDKQAAALTCPDIVSDLGQECMEKPTENELGKAINMSFQCQKFSTLVHGDLFLKNLFVIT